MKKTQELSVDLRTNVIDSHEVGNSYFDISKSLDIRRSTVQCVIKKFSKFCNVETFPGRGLKPKVSVKTMRKLRRPVSNNSRLLFKNVAKQLDAMRTSVSKRTIQRCLNRKQTSMVADLDELHCISHVMLLLV